MLSLIENMLDLTRGRLSGGPPLNREVAALEPVLQAVISELKSSQPDRMVETKFSLAEPLKLRSAPDCPAFLEPPRQCFHVWSKDEPIRVEAACDADGFELRVVNSGDPCPSTALEHLFQPFYRSPF